MVEEAPSGARALRIEQTTPLARSLHIVFFLTPALLYYMTACRTPGWMDATLVVSEVTRLTLSSWVDSHNLFNLLGYFWLKLFPDQNIHFHLVLLSALFGALSVYFIFRTVLELTSDVISAGIAALVLMVSHSVWWHSTMVEVHTLISAIMAVMFFSIARYERSRNPLYLYLAAFFFGLGCSTHVLMGLFVLSFLAVLIHSIIRRHPHTGKYLSIAVLCFLLGLGLYLFLFIRDVRAELFRQTGGGQESWLAKAWQALRSTFDDATGGEFKQLMFTPGMPVEPKRFWRIYYFFLLFLNFPSPALAMGFYGLWAFWRKSSFRLTFVFFTTAILVLAVWSANYFVWDMYAFAQPVYVMFSIPVGLAAERLLHAPKNLRLAFLVLLAPILLLPGFIYANLPVWYHDKGFLKGFFESYPQISFTAHTWEPVEYIVNTNKRNYDKVERYANAVFAVLPPGAHFLTSDSRSDYPLRYYYRDLYHIRTDIVYHSLFSAFPTVDYAKALAFGLQQPLERGEPVFTASILYPERLVLDQLFLLNDPSRSLDTIQALSTDEYASSFPGVDFEKIVLFEAEQIWIYRLVPKRKS